MGSIALNALSYAYDEHMLLKHFSLTVQKGERLVLLGPSGCGKTTLGRTLIRLYDPTSGQITFKGKDYTNLSKNELREARRDFQMIFQVASIFLFF